MKVRVRVTEPSRGSVRRAAVVCFVLLAIGVAGYSEWRRAAIGKESAEKSKEIWNSFTLLDTAETDFQQAQWNETSDVDKAAEHLRNYARSFGEMRSSEERSVLQNLNLYLARRARVPKLAQTVIVDSVFKEQMNNLRGAIDRTDQMEKRRVEMEMAQIRGEMTFKLFVLGTILVAFFLLHWALFRRGGSGSRRRRSEMKRFRVE